MKKIISIIVSFSVLPYLLLAGTGVSAASAFEKPGKLTVSNSSNSKNIFAEISYPGNNTIAISAETNIGTMGFSSNILSVNQQREDLIQAFIAKGWPEKYAKLAVSEVKDAEVVVALANKDSIEHFDENLAQENGIIGCLIVILIIVWIIALCSAKKSQLQKDHVISLPNHVFA